MLSVVVYLSVLVAHDGHYHLLALEDQYLLYYQEDPVDPEYHLYSVAVIAFLLCRVCSEQYHCLYSKNT